MPIGIAGSPAPSTRRLDDDQAADAVSHRLAAAGQSAATRSPIPSAAQDRYGSAAARDALKAFNDGVLYVGMNADSFQKEVSGLRATGAPVTPIARTDGTTTAKLDGVVYDLSSEKGAKAFAGALATKNGLTKETAAALTDVLMRCGVDGRDELAAVATIWARGEAGGKIPSRVVISGHHGESSFLGSFSEADLVRLGHALPNAAKQIEDIHFSGCMTEGNVNLRSELTATFPNLRTLWGYSGLAPNAPVGHLQSWERATRGRGEVGVSTVRGRENAVAWSRDAGVVGRAPTLDERRIACRQADGRFDAFKAGRLTDHDAMHVDYTAYQAVAQAPAGAVTDAERADAAAKAGVMLRLRKYELVREAFAKTYGSQIASACAKAGVEAPDFGKLSRAEALARIAEIGGRVAAVDPETQRILSGLADLRSDVVKQEWCSR